MEAINLRKSLLLRCLFFFGTLLNSLLLAGAFFLFFTMFGFSVSYKTKELSVILFFAFGALVVTLGILQKHLLVGWLPKRLTGTKKKLWVSLIFSVLIPAIILITYVTFFTYPPPQFFKWKFLALSKRPDRPLLYRLRWTRQPKKNEVKFGEYLDN